MFGWLLDHSAAAQGMSNVGEPGWTFTLEPPAGEEDIERCEAAIGLQLPPSYRAFLLRWNGASLFQQKRQTPGRTLEVSSAFEIRGTSDLPSFHQQTKARYSDEEWGNLILLNNFPRPGGPDYCALTPELSTATGEYAVVDCHEDYGPRCWWRAIVAPSFEVWLERAFDAAFADGDPYYWLNLPELQAIYRECDEELQREAAERRARSRG